MKRFWLFFLTLIVLSSCGDDKTPVAPDVDVYRGTYLVRDVTLVIDAQKKDSVLFTLSGGNAYEMFFWDIGDKEFCDCEGRVYGLSTPSVTFEPTDTMVANCDAVRIPSGVFAADYATHGDTVYFEKRIGDSLFQLILRQI